MICGTDDLSDPIICFLFGRTSDALCELYLSVVLFGARIVSKVLDAIEVLLLSDGGDGLRAAGLEKFCAPAEILDVLKSSASARLSDSKLTIDANCEDRSDAGDEEPTALPSMPIV